MAKVFPFAGLRPANKLANQVASPPYDVINTQEARDLVKENKNSFLFVVRPEINLKEGIDLYDNAVYEAGAEALRRLINEGVLAKDPAPFYYLYRQIMGDHIQVGFMACVTAEEYDADIIKKHEFTRPDKEDDRTRHIQTQSAHAGPVFLTYRADQENDGVDTLSEILSKTTNTTPEVDFTAPDGIQHTLWVIANIDDLETIQLAFEEVPSLYVADGHHRSASGARVANMRKDANPNHTGDEEYNRFLAVIFPHNQLKILAYNRAVKSLNGMTPNSFFEALEETYTVTKTNQKTPLTNGHISMYFIGNWYDLYPRTELLNDPDEVARLDVSILQTHVLGPLLGIDDPRRSKKIDFVGGIRGTEELEKKVNSGKFAIAFSMYPTTVEQLLDVADAGKTMPPKSTWFEPKLRSGLVVHLIDE